MINDGDLVAHLFGLFEIMGGQEDSGACIVKLFHVIPERLSQFHIHACCRLIEDNYRRGMDKCLGDQQPAPHTARQRPRVNIRLVV